MERNISKYSRSPCDDTLHQYCLLACGIKTDGSKTFASQTLFIYVTFAGLADMKQQEAFLGNQLSLMASSV